MHKLRDAVPAGSRLSDSILKLTLPFCICPRLARDAGQAGADTELESAGALLLQAYPDRVAKSRGGGGRFVLANGRGLKGAPGGEITEHDDNLLPGDELLDNRGGLARLGLVILGDELKFPAEDAARGVGLLEREDGALVDALAVRGLLAGERGKLAELDGLLGGQGGSQHTGAESEPKDGGQGTD